MSFSGLCDAGNYWYNTFKRHIQNDLMLTSVLTDRYLYTTANNNIFGVPGSQVDDIICGGDPQFPKYWSKTKDELKTKGKVFDLFEFTVISI